jgi:hypothetical protein
MVVDPLSRAQIEADLVQAIEKLTRQLIQASPGESEGKDAAMGWMLRGQIKALEGFRERLNKDD